MECFIASQSRKRGERFLQLMAASLATEEAVSNVLPIRPVRAMGDVQKARREATALFKQLLPVFIARLRI
jgi:hypothetical protein